MTEISPQQLELFTFMAKFAKSLPGPVGRPQRPYFNEIPKHLRPALGVSIPNLIRKYLGDGTYGFVQPECWLYLADEPAEPDVVGDDQDQDAPCKAFVKDDFDIYANEYLREHATPDHKVTAKELADYLKTKNPAGTCSTATVDKLRAWRTYQDEWNKKHPSKPKKVRFTEKLEKTTGTGAPREMLDKLIKEQETDDNARRIDRTL